MRCKGKHRLARVLFRDHIIEFPLPVTFIQKARQRGLKIRHPVNGKVTIARYVTSVVYWTKKAIVYVFSADD